MCERLLVKGLDAVVGIATLGKKGLELNPELKEYELQHEDEEVVPGIPHRGTLLVIDDESKRLITRYRVFDRDRDSWGDKSSREGGSGDFVEGTGKSLEDRMFSSDDLL